MKRIIKLFPAALAVLALASCSDINEPEVKQQVQPGKTKIVATIDQGTITRVGMGRTTDGKRGLVFTNGDLLNVYDLNSTKFCAYKATGLEDGTGNDEVEFEFDAANSSSGVTEFDLTDESKEFYAVTRTGDDQKVYSLSAGSAGPELTMSIPKKYTKEDVVAQWAENSKSGKGYTFPLPLWGKVVAGGEKNIGTSANVMVNLRYLTGFLGINITTMRAGTKYLKIEADKAISGYFHTVLDPAADDKANVSIPAAGAMPANLLAPHEALTTNTEITVELPEANDYEGATDMFYVPLIAQKYETLTIKAYDANDVEIQTLYTLPAGGSYTAKRGKGVTLECGMVVMSNLTNGVDISKKIDELCKRNKEFTIGLYQSLTSPTTIYIDKDATSTINIQMLKVDGEPAPAVTGAITIVEATPKTRDEAGFVTEWETDATNQNSLSATKKHEVNFIYNSSVVNTGAISFYLPNSAASIIDDNNLANGEFGANPYKGQVKSLTARDGGFTIAGNLNPNDAGKGYENYKDGGVFVGVADDAATTDVDETVKGYTQYLYQKGNSAVTINNLDKAMQEIQMGTTTASVTGALTINGAAQTGNGNGATVNTLSYNSTGAFTANKLDGAPSGVWKFNETAAGVAIKNDGNYISWVKELIFNKKNDLTIENAWIDAFKYNATVKATVTATKKSAIKSFSGTDSKDMVSISSTWNGLKLDPAKDKVKGAAAAVADMLDTEVNTAFQLANLVTTADINYTLKSTTVLDMACAAATDKPKWTPLTTAKAISINGDGNNQSASAKIKNLYNVPAADKHATYNGFFGNVTTAGTLALTNLQFEGIEFGNATYCGALIGSALNSTDGATNISNVVVGGTVKIKAQAAADGKGAKAGGLIGMVATLNAEGVAFTAAEVEAVGATADGFTSVAGGMVGVAGKASIALVSATATSVKAEDVAGGLIGELTGALTVTSPAAAIKNEISATTVEVTEASANMGVGGLIGYVTSTGSATVVTTAVTAGLKGFLNQGGMVGNFAGTTLKFGNDTKAGLCEVAATFTNIKGSAFDNATNKETFGSKLGSANTYVGNVAAGSVEITEWCKHGTPISTVAQKENLLFKENVKVIDDGHNKNYLYFWSGNPWVGTVATGATITFPDASNVKAARTDETDYNVRKDKNYYLADSWTADWE